MFSQGLLQMAAAFTLSEQLSQTGGGGGGAQLQQRNGIQAKMHLIFGNLLYKQAI